MRQLQLRTLRGQFFLLLVEDVTNVLSSWHVKPDGGDAAIDVFIDPTSPIDLIPVIGSPFRDPMDAGRLIGVRLPGEPPRPSDARELESVLDSFGYTTLG